MRYLCIKYWGKVSGFGYYRDVKGMYLKDGGIREIKEWFLKKKKSLNKYLIMKSCRFEIRLEKLGEKYYVFIRRVWLNSWWK